MHLTLGSAHPCGCTYPFGYAKGVKRCPTLGSSPDARQRTRRGEGWRNRKTREE
jgi:hypothetical protein